VLYAAALVPLSLAPTLMGLTGRIYFGGALVLGVAFVALTLRFARTRAVPDARRVFFGSIIYLPLIWTLMIANKL
jgi:protoheme IX farnesyltransferase